MAILKGQCHLGKILICYKAGPVIPKTIVKILKKFFFTLKMSILIKFFVLVVTKMRHLGTNIVMKTHYPEQTLLPKCITRSQTCKLLKKFYFQGIWGWSYQKGNFFSLSGTLYLRLFSTLTYSLRNTLYLHQLVAANIFTYYPHWRIVSVEPYISTDFPLWHKAPYISTHLLDT